MARQAMNHRKRTQELGTRRNDCPKKLMLDTPPAVLTYTEPPTEHVGTHAAYPASVWRSKRWLASALL